jgi:hypothetical protein
MVPLLLAGTAGAVALYEGGKAVAYRFKKWTLQPGHHYTVVLRYSGAGVGGPLSTDQLNQYLSTGNPAGAAPGTVISTTTSTPTPPAAGLASLWAKVDPTPKLITYTLSTVDALTPLTVTPLELIGTTFPAAFGRVHVVSVTDQGSSPTL